MSAKYKLEKEAFVTNHNGGTVFEINQITLVAPIAVLLWSALHSSQSFFKPYSLVACFVDFLLNCVAILFATTVYSARPMLLNGFLGMPALLIILVSMSARYASVKSHKSHRAITSKNQPNLDPFPVKPFVTHYRGTMMVATCVAILAVDFKVFPRRFAKVENWGTSLMDLGVGSFVFSAGTIAARPILKAHLTKQQSTMRSRLKAALRHAFPLFVLGLIRLYSVKGLDYAEHVTEYGVHWNFFFTLALVPPFVALFDWLFSFLPSYALLALFLAGVYELALDFTDLKGYIMTAPRTTFLSKNREGIFSSLGYLSIFLAGQATGMYVLPGQQKFGGSFRDTTLRKLATWSGIWSVLYFLSTSYDFGLNLEVSRRLANLPYILWVTAFNTSQLTLFCAIERFAFGDIYNDCEALTQQARLKNSTSTLLRVFNRNGLAIFLVANLLTGLVNLTIPTLHIGDAWAMAILMAYVAALSGVGLVLDYNNISIKL